MVWAVILWKSLCAMIAQSGPITSNKYQAFSHSPMVHTHFSDDGPIFLEPMSLWATYW